MQRKLFAVTSLKVDSSLQVIVRSEAFEKTSATDDPTKCSKHKQIYYEWTLRDTHGPSCKENSVAENIVCLATYRSYSSYWIQLLEVLST